MASARLESYKQGWGADVFVWNAGTPIEIVVGWGLLQSGLTVAWALNPDGTRKEELRRWAESIPAQDAIRALGYDHLIVPPWLAAVVQSADEIR